MVSLQETACKHSDIQDTSVRKKIVQ